MGKIDRKKLHQKVLQAKRLGRYVNWGLKLAAERAEKTGEPLDVTAIELALMNRAGRNLDTLAAAAGPGQRRCIKRAARRAEALVAHFLSEEHPELGPLSAAIAYVALAKKAVVGLDRQVMRG